jgi:hypothetical protein
MTLKYMDTKVWPICPLHLNVYPEGQNQLTHWRQWFFFFLVMSKFEQILPQNLQNWLKLYQENTFFENFPDFFLEKKQKFTRNKNIDWRHKLIILTKRTKFTRYKM